MAHRSTVRAALAAAASLLTLAACSKAAAPPAQRPAASATASKVALLAGSVAADGRTPAEVLVTARDTAGAPSPASR